VVGWVIVALYRTWGVGIAGTIVARQRRLIVFFYRGPARYRLDVVEAGCHLYASGGPIRSTIVATDHQG
jgi:hypothetical protein